MKKPIASEYLKQALKAVNYFPPRLDPASKKLYNKWNREYKQWEKQCKEETKEEKKVIKFRNYQGESLVIQREIENEKHYEYDYHNLIEEMNNTIEWNVEHQCKYNKTSRKCDSRSMRVVCTPKGTHYAKEICNLCDTFNKWVPYPDFEPHEFDD
tara:strand:+ start:43 stop:507 length:465 start_codon:yes stop_codon:yes gene_type:complete